MRPICTIVISLILLLGCRHKAKKSMTKEERITHVETYCEFKKICVEHDHTAAREFILDCVTCANVDPKNHLDRESIIEECSYQAYKDKRSCVVWIMLYHDRSASGSTRWLPCAGAKGAIKTLCDRWTKNLKPDVKEGKHVIVP